MVEQSGWVLAGAALMTAGSVGRVMLGAQTIGGDVADMVAHAGSAFLLLYWLRAFAEDLCVSVGTVNTYLRRIYQKMDIHSRQELLDLFDNVPPAS